MIWTESDSWRVAILAVDYDALPFVHIGQFGVQPVLMPHKVYPWREADTPRKHEPKRRASRSR